MFALATYRGADGGFRTALVHQQQLYDLARFLDCPEASSPAALFSDWERLVARTSERVADIGSITPSGRVSDFELGLPVPENGAVFCAAANYRDHMLAMARKLNIEPEPDPRTLDVSPYHFLKPSRQALCSGGEIVLPAHAELVDWEIELVAVIGREARDVTPDAALEHVAGYTVGIDLSVRDRRYMKRPNVPDGSLFRTDFLAMKGFENSCPLGPVLVPAQFLSDPQHLNLRLWVDGELRQDSSSAEMIFTVAQQISHLSRITALLPGDMIMTGTPAGTGAETGIFLKRGQALRAYIEGIGTLDAMIA